MKVVLVGPPNSGKTTLFNALTHSKCRTVNYPGSTVEVHVGTVFDSPQIDIMDTPGVLSLNPVSPDEQITTDILAKLEPNQLVVAVINATQLGRHLPLIKQCVNAGYPLRVVVTMADQLQKHNQTLDIAELATQLGVPVELINAHSKSDIARVSRQISVNLETPHRPKTPYDMSIDELYKWTDEVVAKVLHGTMTQNRWDPDSLFLHPVFGGLLFTAIMTGIFWSVFSVAAPFMDGIKWLFSVFVLFLATHLPDMWISRLLSEGIVGGIGAVLVFVPQIGILFFVLGLMEDSGYLARGALIVDKPLSALGLNGRSFVPLLSGCACAIPAIMAARTIPDRKERLVTQFVIPLMSCSARLPVYGLLIGLLLGTHRPFLSGLVLTLIYFASIAMTSVMAVCVAKVLGMKEKADTGFQIELPPYRVPNIPQIWIHLRQQVGSFISKAAPIIVVVGVGLFCLTTLPTKTHSFAVILGHFLEPILSPMGVDWRVGFALIVAFAAREVFVSALTVMFAGAPIVLTPGAIVGLIVFFMVSMQCMSTLAVAKKEMGHWKWPVAMMILYVGLAYVLAVGANQAWLILRVG